MVTAVIGPCNCSFLIWHRHFAFSLSVSSPVPILTDWKMDFFCLKFKLSAECIEYWILVQIKYLLEGNWYFPVNEMVGPYSLFYSILLFPTQMWIRFKRPQELLIKEYRQFIQWKRTKSHLNFQRIGNNALNVHIQCAFMFSHINQFDKCLEENEKENFLKWHTHTNWSNRN